MIVFKTITTDQTFKVIPRIFADEFSLSITDDSTNIPVVYDITTGVISGNYLTFNQSFNPILVDIVVAKFGSFPNAVASSFNVSNVLGDESTNDAILFRR